MYVCVLVDFIVCSYLMGSCPCFVAFLPSSLWIATACDCWLLEQSKTKTKRKKGREGEIKLDLDICLVALEWLVTPVWRGRSLAGDSFTWVVGCHSSLVGLNQPHIKCLLLDSRLAHSDSLQSRRVGSVDSKNVCRANLSIQWRLQELLDPSSLFHLLSFPCPELNWADFIEHTCSLEGLNCWINYTIIQWYRQLKMTKTAWQNR